MDARVDPVEDSNSPSASSPIEYLLARLRSEGFSIGTGHYIRVEVLLARIDPNSLLEGVPPERQWEASQAGYRRLLRPLFATTAEQQAQFDAIFNEFYDLYASFAPDPGKQVQEAKRTPA